MSERYIKIIKVFVFISILIIGYFLLTYLQRNVGVDRENVVGIKSEKKNSIDAVFIGGSATFVYWQPLYAYDKYRFTSYNLATNTLQAESVISCVKYALKYQKPKLFVIGLRPFQYYEDKGSDPGIRNSTDSIDIGFIRLELAKRYLRNRTNLDDSLSYYIDLIKYHSRIRTFFRAKHWKLILNTFENSKKGFFYVNKYKRLSTPSNFMCASRSELNKNNEYEFKKLCDYLSKRKAKVLFTVCPYYILQEHYSIYNSLKDIIDEYGFDYINTNDCYNDLGIDFSNDFYNVAHVNIFGSNKYTDYVGKYIKSKYGLMANYSDDVLKDWDDKSKVFLNEKEGWEKEIQNLRKDTVLLE